MEKKVYFGLCPTEAAKSDKVVYLQGFESIPKFEEGDLLTVHFADKSETETVKLFMSTDDIGDSSPTTDSGNSAKMCGVEPTGIEGWDFVNAWEAGETKQFVYISRPDGNDTTGPYETYWLILDGGNATSDLYGDTKLFNQLTAAWLKEAPGDDEEITAITPATIRALFQGDESSEEDTLQLIWSQDSNEFDPESDILLGDMCLSTRLDDPQEIYIPRTPITEIVNTAINDKIKKTSDIPINDGSLSDDNYRYIENYDDANIQFVGGYFKVGAPAESESSEAITPPTELYGSLTVHGTSNLGITNAGMTTVNSLDSLGKINGRTTIEAAGKIESILGSVISHLDIKEAGEWLKDKYSGRLFVQRYHSPVMTLDGGAHNHDKKISISKDGGWTPLGIVSWNINQPPNVTQSTHCIYPWELYMTDSYVYMGFHNIKTTSVQFYLSVDVLYVKNTGTQYPLVNKTPITRGWS